MRREGEAENRVDDTLILKWNAEKQHSRGPTPREGSSSSGTGGNHNKKYQFSSSVDDMSQQTISLGRVVLVITAVTWSRHEVPHGLFTSVVDHRPLTTTHAQCMRDSFVMSMSNKFVC